MVLLKNFKCFLSGKDSKVHNIRMSQQDHRDYKYHQAEKAEIIRTCDEERFQIQVAKKYYAVERSRQTQARTKNDFMVEELTRLVWCCYNHHIYSDSE